MPFYVEKLTFLTFDLIFRGQDLIQRVDFYFKSSFFFNSAHFDTNFIYIPYSGDEI